MISVQIDNQLGTMLFDSAFPKTEYGESVQKLNENNEPLWSVNVILRQPGSRRSENMTVTVPSKTDPAVSISPFTPVGFENLRILTGSSGGRTWVSFAADACGKIASK